MKVKADTWAGNERDRLRHDAALSFSEKLAWLEKETTWLKRLTTRSMTAAQIENQYWQRRADAALDSAGL